jgi:hypothetical protein
MYTVRRDRERHGFAKPIRHLLYDHAPQQSHPFLSKSATRDLHLTADHAYHA